VSGSERGIQGADRTPKVGLTGEPTPPDDADFPVEATMT
jgi:hypothetical protein